MDALDMSGAMRTLPAASLEDLRGVLNGPLVFPADEGYDAARRLAWPATRFDRRPAFIVRASGPADVALAVTFARENSLLLAVKGGGHSDFGIGARDGAMMLDLSLLRGVRISAAQRRAEVAGGTLAGLIDHEAGARGLAVPLGDTPTVGIGGLALGGGFGKLGRRYGLTTDAIRAVDIVCADGRLRRASPDENPDLFWALRGGGGNFGVATAFELALQPIPPQVLAGQITFDYSQARQVLRAYGHFAATAPDVLHGQLLVQRNPDDATSFLRLDVCWSGDLAEGQRAMETIRRFGRVTGDTVRPVTYPMAQGATAHAARHTSASSTAPRPRETYFQSGFLDVLDEALASMIVEALSPHPDRRFSMLFLHGGGEIARTDPGTSPFPHRTALHDMIFVATWPRGPGEQEHRAEVTRIWRQLETHTRGFYGNDMAGGVTAAEVAANFGSHAARLAGVKARYDPSNLFRLNANIEPAPRPARS
ncbi:MAG TPA: FAD-binding oxidoreductase [Usitatibacter sp.]|nr:FAD-binding oxidoreductase [Usitatibacter sp.]